MFVSFPSSFLGSGLDCFAFFWRIGISTLALFIIPVRKLICRISCLFKCCIFQTFQLICRNTTALQLFKTFLCVK